MLGKGLIEPKPAERASGLSGKQEKERQENLEEAPEIHSGEHHYSYFPPDVDIINYTERIGLKCIVI